MALTDAQLCNLALGRVGIRATIDSLEEATTEAQQCKVYFAQARDSVLASAWWPFATARAVLAETAEVRDGWVYAYALPVDCMAPRYLWAGQRNPPTSARAKYAVELNDAGSWWLLLADVSPATLVYTRKVDSLALFPPLVADAVAWRLAVDLVLALPVKPHVASLVEAKARAALVAAMAAEAAKEERDEAPEAGAILARS